mmetsp:Transcript_17358/g.41816  ORF Transcript_17358/g.41816 Transcript_17358/m.41816 type:complete len:393 (+) Transcript_17358:746-1924(+)
MQGAAGGGERAERQDLLARHRARRDQGAALGGGEVSLARAQPLQGPPEGRQSAGQCARGGRGCSAGRGRAAAEARARPQRNGPPPAAHARCEGNGSKGYGSSPALRTLSRCGLAPERRSEPSQPPRYARSLAFERRAAAPQLRDDACRGLAVGRRPGTQRDVPDAAFPPGAAAQSAPLQAVRAQDCSREAPRAPAARPRAGYGRRERTVYAPLSDSVPRTSDVEPRPCFDFAARPSYDVDPCLASDEEPRTSDACPSDFNPRLAPKADSRLACDVHARTSDLASFGLTSAAQREVARDEPAAPQLRDDACRDARGRQCVGYVRSLLILSRGGAGPRIASYVDPLPPSYLDSRLASKADSRLSEAEPRPADGHLPPARQRPYGRLQPDPQEIA